METDIINKIMKSHLNRILTKVDYLGFSSLMEAKQAILQHTDWEVRWEVTDLPEADIQILRDFYKSYDKWVDYKQEYTSIPDTAFTKKSTVSLGRLVDQSKPTTKQIKELAVSIALLRAAIWTRPTPIPSKRLETHSLYKGVTTTLDSLTKDTMCSNLFMDEIHKLTHKG